jgi:hypothetical protein
VTRSTLPLSRPLARSLPPFASVLTPRPGAGERLRVDRPRRSRGAGPQRRVGPPRGDARQVADPSSGRRGLVRAAVGIVEPVPVARLGRGATEEAGETAARRRSSAGPGPWLRSALAVSEQATLDEPSNTTLQPMRGAVTGVRRSIDGLAPGRAVVQSCWRALASGHQAPLATEDRVRIISARTATRRESHAHQERSGKDR